MSNLTHLSGIPEVEGIRGIAIGRTPLFHCVLQDIDALAGSFLSRLQGVTRLTWSGVDPFFVLSAFLISGEAKEVYD